MDKNAFGRTVSVLIVHVKIPPWIITLIQIKNAKAL